MVNLSAYPIKYSLACTQKSNGPILEVGCGGGRILRYYHNRGNFIVGFDYVTEIVERLKQSDSSLNLTVGDIKKLGFRDSTFGCVLAFGVFHNIETDMASAIREASRVLRSGGLMCASFRADNLNTRLNDWLWNRSHRSSRATSRIFHKVNLTKLEILQRVSDCGFSVSQIVPAENMPLLYKFPLFRERAQKQFNENAGRLDGYRLSRLGRLVQNFLMWLAPNAFCNLFVVFATKTDNQNA